MLKEKISEQFKNLMSDCRYTSEAHHSIAADSEKIDFWSRVVPAVLAGLSSASEVIFQPESNILIILTFLFAVTSAVTNVIGAKEKKEIHLKAAKKFTRIKKICNKAIEIDFYSSNDDEYKALYEKTLGEYLSVVDEVPATDDKAFTKAQKRIKEDKVHEPD